MNKRLTTTLIIIGIIGCIYYFYSNKENRKITNEYNNIVSQIEVKQEEGRDVPKGYLEYKNDTYKFSLIYPENLSVMERYQAGKALTIIFQNTNKFTGFQIFIVPYAEEQVSEERFKMDAPSGVRAGLKDVNVDGATGATFYSKDGNLGDTKEVWFVRNGFLYEVSTLKNLESWLEEIINTWKFI